MSTVEENSDDTEQEIELPTDYTPVSLRLQQYIGKELITHRETHQEE